MTDNPQALQAFIRAVRGLTNATVAAGVLDGDEALGALMYVISHMIGRVAEPVARKVYVDSILETLPGAVEFEAGNPEAMRIHEADRRKMQ